MSRKNRSLKRRIFGAVASYALVGACAYSFFAGMSLLASFYIGLAVLGIATPVVNDGGGFVELVVGVIEAFIEGIAAVVEAIAGSFSL